MAVVEVPSAWKPLRSHPVQQGYWTSPHRFNVVPAGRRSGKTELAKRKIVKRAMLGTDFRNPRFFAGAPTRPQAKLIWWDDLKALVPTGMLAGRPSETELSIPLKNGASIWVVGMDRPERIEGSPWDGGVLDEYGNMRKHAWPLHVRPALSDRRGWCDFIGVPEGRNHYYDLYQFARAEYEAKGEDSDWAAWHWVSADILPPEEIAAAMNEMDELSFQQEYGASFVNFFGNAYYPFREALHVGRLVYRDTHPLIICLDFNVEPGVAAVCQEQELPDHETEGTGVIGEVHIPRNSNTEAVCRRLIKDWGEHKGDVKVYGDATGGARGTAQVVGSDWDIAKSMLRGHFKDRVSFRVPQANPQERPRVNSVNGRLQSADGTVRLMVDRTKAPHVVKDFEGVRLLEGGSGEIDKKADPSLTHLTDALGYYIHREFPIATGRESRSIVAPFMR